jgi:DNA polymerase III subunit beta
MEFTIQKGEFVKGLSRAQGVVDRKSTMPILANILLSAAPKKGLTIAATDLGVGVTGSYGADVKKGGGVTIAAKSFYEIVKNLPEDLISVSVGDNHRALIRAGRVEYKIVGTSDADYPKLPDPEGVGFSSLDAQVFSDMIEKTLFSVSTDETRYHLNGVYLTSKGDKLRMVSTDGHRLSMVSRPVATAGLEVGGGVIIPRKGLLEVKRLLEEAGSSPVEVGLRGSNVYLRRSDVTLSVKLIDAQFPDYEQVVPKQISKRATVGRQALSDALRRISLLSSDKSWGVKLSFAKNLLQIASDNPDLGEAREELEVDYDNTDLTIGFNARYILDVLSATESTEVVLGMNDEISPGVISPVEDEDYTCVIMPMRI